MSKAILIHFSGKDKPGLVAEMTAILASFNTCVLDIGQAVVHESVSLGLLIEVPIDGSLQRLEDTLLARCRDIGLQVTFLPIAKSDLDAWIASQGRQQFIVTILGRAISAQHL